MAEMTNNNSLSRIPLLVCFAAVAIAIMHMRSNNHIKPAIMTGLHSTIPMVIDESSISSWMNTDVDSSLMQGYERCNIEKLRENDMTPSRFYEEFWRNKPVILLREENLNKVAQSMTQKETLLNDFANASIPLAKMESYAYRDEQSGLLKDYIDKMSQEEIPSRASQFAFSTDRFGIGKVYAVPRILSSIPNLLDPSFQIAIAGSGSGLAFHWHGDVFAETLHGSRRWFLFAPHTSPQFNPRSTSADWVRSIRSSLFTDQNETPTNIPQNLQECTMKQNEVIYVPADWFHSTLSLGEAVSITTSFASTYRQDRYAMDNGTSDNAKMLDAFSKRDYMRAIHYAKKVIQHRTNNFAPYSWLGLLQTMDAMEHHTETTDAFRVALQVAHQSTSQCIKLNPHFCPCHVWATRQLMALSFTFKDENPSIEQSLVKQAQYHTRMAEKLSSTEDDEMLDPGFQPKVMKEERRKPRV